MKNNDNQSCTAINQGESIYGHVPDKQTDIAIVGMACRLPGARNYDEFWQNLKRKQSSIQEIPMERWDWRDFWGDPKTEINKSNSKWGGFIADVDAFDAGFFSFSPREAEAMDPQQRIMLELAWTCLEDAGIRPSRLSGKKVGVYVGVFNFDYKELQEQKYYTIETYHSTGTASALIANRISHYFNFRGPSFPIDAACSGSLVAIHSAIMALNSGECSMALAGGINLLLTPARHISFCKTGMLSPTGSCKTFDENADGYVRSEGAGLILLKPLNKAISDGDSVYGILKGSAVNHSGKTHTLTFPSAEAQADVILDALKRAKTEPDTISYIESHGTGTPKGDPIEFQGLQKAFAGLCSKQSANAARNYCGLGSVKTNIGHLEAAAGIAGVIKVLLSMKYRRLPGLLNFKKLNHRISIKASPFYVVDRLQDWKTLEDEKKQAIPRRAGVSSFGYGGTNAHVILEEAPGFSKRAGNTIPGYLICLSAKTRSALRQKEEDLLCWLEERGQEHHLADLSMTLGLGREHFDVRSAFVVKTARELKEKLKQVLSEGKPDGYLQPSHAVKGDLMRPFFAELGRTIIEKICSADIQSEKEYSDKLKALAELYVNGYNPDWKMIFPGKGMNRLHLPTYPFARERHWIPAADTGTFGTKTTGEHTPAVLHPLLHQNTSDFNEQRFSSTFTAGMFSRTGHIVKGQRILPRVACLEMARAAVERSTCDLEDNRNVFRLKNVLWTRDVALGEKATQVHIRLFPDDDGQITYEMYSDSIAGDGSPTMHGQGKAELGPAIAPPVLDIAALQAQCRRDAFSAGQYYEAFSAMGIEYGTALRVIEDIHLCADRALVRIALPSSSLDGGDRFLLLLRMLDVAVQASIGLATGADHMNMASGASVPLSPLQPISLDELEILDGLEAAMWGIVRYSAGSRSGDNPRKLDVDICDGLGNIGVRLKGLELREITGNVGAGLIGTKNQNRLFGKDREAFELMLFQEVWSEQALKVDSSAKNGIMVCFLSDCKNQQGIVKAVQSIEKHSVVVFISQGDIYRRRSRQAYSISRTGSGDYEKAFRSIREDYGEVDALLYMWAIEDPGCIQDYANIVRILKGLAAADVRTRRLVLAAQFGNALERCYLESWIGFERSLELVLPHTQVAVIIHEVNKHNRDGAMAQWLPNLLAELRTRKPQSALYRDGKRHVCRVRPASLPSNPKSFRAGGTYLITGGLGGLGFLFAQHIAQKQSVNLILIGRSSMDVEKERKIEALEKSGSRVDYIQGDICDEDRLKKGLDQAKKRFGGIHGVIHAAGIAGNQSILEKNIQTFQKVLEPKIKGTLVLDKLLENEPLDFICYFSSSAAILGDFGVCDYAVGNRFQMAYAHCRNQRKGRGRAFAINWPLWKDGGIRLGLDVDAEMYLKTSGQRFLEAEEGVSLFDRILSQESTQHLVLAGQRGRVHRFLGLVDEQSAPLISEVPGPEDRGRRAGMKGLSVEQCLEWDLKELAGKLLKMPRHKLDVDENLAEFGFDSISLAEFAVSLTHHYGIEITPALFFGNSTLKKLTRYFLAEHLEPVQQFYREDDATEEAVMKRGPADPISTRRRAGSRFARQRAAAGNAEPIAVIGMSGRFPQARNIDEMWAVLVQGRDVVEEIPNERFDNPGKWKCGLIPGVREFDPRFFEISPKEAETMDPRQRLLMQESWKALEDAGCGPNRIKNRKIGMFVGVEEGDYHWLAEEKMGITSNHNAILSARLAYFLNLRGPVMAINTACSSGLVAAHQACQSLRTNECDIAVAAGANLMLTPRIFEMLRHAGMLSEDGKCYAFDQRANGMVPGEAVAAIVLKRLSRAEADGDPIYAVIKAGGINYDGKTNGITAPSGNSQTDLLKSIYARYHIDPEEIEYIVTHGTGTKLGDPVEINALCDAFRGDTQKQGYCALTSTKTNLGHTFAASGLVGLISLIMAMRHETIPASLHCIQENDYIDWLQSPFYINKSSRPWPRADLKSRTGAVSAFGMSGTNAHMVVQSYDMEEAEASPDRSSYFLLALSAKTDEALKEKIEDMIVALQSGDWKDHELQQISFILLEGRQHFSRRCAIVVRGLDDAIYLLKTAKGKEILPNLFKGEVPRNFTGQKVMQAYARELLMQSQTVPAIKTRYKEILHGLASLYCQGYDFSWNRLFNGIKMRRLSLPTYPFAKQCFWVPDKGAESGRVALSGPSGFLHPMLQKNTSDFSRQQFSSTFTGKEFFLADHVIRGRRILPGVACLEMARAGVEVSAGALKDHRNGLRLKNVSWIRPIAVAGQDLEVHIGLFPEDNGKIAFEIYCASGSDAAGQVSCQGSAEFFQSAEIPTLDLKSLQSRCNRSTISSGQCYQIFSAMAIEYGPAHRGIEKVYVGDRQVLARLSLPVCVSENPERFILHPSMMDAALQASIGLMTGAGDRVPPFDSGRLKPYLPFALQELDIFGACSARMWAFVRYHAGSAVTDSLQKLDIDLCDDQGKVCARLKGFSSRTLEDGAGRVESAADTGTLMIQPFWREHRISGKARKTDYDKRWVILCEPRGIEKEGIESRMNGVQCMILHSGRKAIEERFEVYAVQILEVLQNILREKISGQALIQVVVTSEAEQQLFCGLSGLLKTAHLENARVYGQLVEIEAGEELERLMEKLQESSQNPDENHVRYRDGKRFAAGRREVEILNPEATVPWKDRGVYLLTGGAGGLGHIFAKEIAQRTEGATLILIGRSTLDEDQRGLLKELEAEGVHAVYKQVDVTREKAVADQLENLRKEFGKLNGIIHCAGVIKDNYIVKKDKKEFLKVLAPKIRGVVNLDRASRNMELDFLILFSSLTGNLGNPGQADYAAANAFMDAYANYRNFLVVSKQRSGKTLSIGWPLWKDGGMHVDKATERWLMDGTGMVAMRTSTGISALYRGLASDLDHFMVIEGNLLRMRQKLLSDPAPTVLRPEKDQTPSHAPAKTDTGGLANKLQTVLMQMISELLKVDPDNIDADTELTEYGFDSITFTAFANIINRKYRLELTPVIFFEHPTIHDFAKHLVENHHAIFFKLFGAKTTVGTPGEVDKVCVEEKTSETDGKPHRFVGTDTSTWKRRDRVGSGPMAIVGMSGRFPMARDIDEFWENIVAGKNCITEIPKERWDWRKYYGDPTEGADKTKVKWGGFIDGADEFDPRFFRISPLDAELMDPQQRLLITYIWMAIEDSGITPDKLSRNPTGVFIAAGPNNYMNLVDIPKNNPVAMTTIFPSIFPNRISYLLNLQGPSEYCETACSSTFYALHRAIQSINCNECDQAIIGAVNLLLSPGGFTGLESMGFLSPSGQIKSFQAGADGYVRSEGAGAIIIKPLEKAIGDRDIIYAVIKGTGVTHGGKGMSLTSPSLKGMKAAMVQAYQAACVDPRTVNYIEAHGIASPMADAIEINALKSAYQELSSSYNDCVQENNKCYISCLKPCIGHGEMVSGMAAIIKVVSAMRHKQIPGIPRLSELDGNICLEGSPFEIASRNIHWRSLSDNSGRRLPRRASINSYGFGGVNTHVVLEEYIAARKEYKPAHLETSPQIILLSARNRERLQAVARQMKEFIERKEDLPLPDLAYTLQVGRVAMESRLAMIVMNKEELRQGLMRYLEAKGEGRPIETNIPTFMGHQDEAPSGVERLLSKELEEPFLKVLLADKDLEKIALYWSRGGRIPWEMLHEGHGVRRIALPTYPFKKNRCWLLPSEKGHPVKTDVKQPFVHKGDIRQDVDGLKRHIKKKISEILGIPVNELPAQKTLGSLGFNSLHAVNIRYILERDFGNEIPMAVLSDNKTVEQLGQDLSKIIELKPENTKKEIIPNSADRYKPFPLSDIQESYLAGRKLRIGGDWAGCHIYFEFELKDLDVYRLGRAWNYMVECHEMLRAVILPNGEQKILKKAPPFQLKVIDLRRKSDLERSAALENVRNQMSHKVYEAGQWPLFDIRISACPETKYVIHFSIDELITDASGIRLLLRQWQQRYENPGWKTPESGISFRDYILALEEFKTDERYGRDLRYWMKALNSMPAGPTFNPAPDLNETGERFYRTRLNGSLGKKQWNALKKKAKNLKVSPTALLLSIFIEVLRLWSENDEFTIILTTLNRLPLHCDVEKIFGPFISTLLFVVGGRKGRSLEKLITDNQELIWKSLDYSHVSGITAMRELKAKRRVPGSLSLPVVFTSLVNNFAGENDSINKSFYEKITFMVTQTPQVYLDHQVSEQQGKLTFSWDVAEKYFGRNVIRNIFHDYCQALEVLASDDDKWDLEKLVLELAGKKNIEKDAVRGDESGAGKVEPVKNSSEPLPAGIKLKNTSADRLKPFPLTDQQQAYIFGRSAYLSGGGFSSMLYQEAEAEKLDIERLEQAWQKLMKAHDMLTAVVGAEGTQRILREKPYFKIKVNRLQGKKAEDVQAELGAIKRRMLEHVFAIGKWPNFDLQVSIINNRMSRIHFSIDMLIADPQSIQLLWNQLFYYYENPKENPQKISVLFRDYVMALQKYKKDNGYQNSFRYWERKFADIPPGPFLSGKEFGEAGIYSEHIQYRGVLEGWYALKEAAGRLSVSSGMILLAAYAEVFSAWMKGESFSVVVPSWQRLPLHPEIYKIVGDFTALSWVVCNGGKMPFERKVRYMESVVKEDLSHMAVSGIKVLRRAVMKNGLNGMPRFPVVFTNLMTHSSVDSSKGFKKLSMISKTPQVYLDNISEEHGEKLYYYWDVVKGIYPGGLIEDMFSGYTRLLETLQREPGMWGNSDFESIIRAQPEKYENTLLN